MSFESEMSNFISIFSRCVELKYTKLVGTIMANIIHKTVILIPSLEPDEKLPHYVQQLQGYGFGHIVIVDDGSGEKFQPLFAELSHQGCIVLQHTKNLGKGAALKTGFRYIEQQFQDAACIVTADSDGQHAAEDVYRLAMEAALQPEALILGIRDFSKGGIPPKSLVGNRVASSMFALLYGKKLSDTQTGLRAFGPGWLPFFQDIRGSRFEYELQMLISCIHAGVTISTLPIQVIYEQGNTGTHFRAVQDSLRVMKVLFTGFLQFILSSLGSSIVDLGIAWLLMDALRPMLEEQAFLRIWIATVTARVISIGVNYWLNKHFVFRKKGGRGSLWRYLSLCALVIMLSSGGVYMIHTIFLLNEKIAKLICDAMLFLLSYQVQQRWVFAARGHRLP